jgi:hypothetical protein
MAHSSTSVQHGTQQHEQRCAAAAAAAQPVRHALLRCGSQPTASSEHWRQLGLMHGWAEGDVRVVCP